MIFTIHIGTRKFRLDNQMLANTVFSERYFAGVNFPLSCSGTYYPSSTEIQVILHALLPRGPSGEGAAYNGLYGEAPPKKATFFPCGVLPLMAYTIKVEKKFYF